MLHKHQICLFSRIGHKGVEAVWQLDFTPFGRFDGKRRDWQ